MINWSTRRFRVAFRFSAAIATAVLASPIWLANPGISAGLEGQSDRFFDTEGLVVTAMPYLPHLVLDREPQTCSAFEAAQLQSFKSIDRDITTVDRDWPGQNIDWLISPATLSELNRTDLTRSFSADLDRDGNAEYIVLIRREHSWRGNVFSLTRFTSKAELDAFTESTGNADPGAGESILIHESGGSGPLRWDWDAPVLLSAFGNYYLLDENADNDPTAPSTLYRIPKKGSPEPVCTVELFPEDLNSWQQRAGLEKLLSDLRKMVGESGYCGGTLSGYSFGVLRQSILNAQFRALFRPWAIEHVPYNDRETVDRRLALWATDGLWNWRVHQQFQDNEPKARTALLAWYTDEFGIEDAGWVSDVVLDNLIRLHFSFPQSPEGNLQPNELRYALLSGASVEDVARMLASRDMTSPTYQEGMAGTDSLLVLAVQHPELVQLLLDSGASVDRPNSFGKTPLMYAAQFGDAETLRILLAAGADPKAKTIAVRGCTVLVKQGSRTALHYAAENAGLAVMKSLIQAGADVNARDNERSGNPDLWPIDYLDHNTTLSDQERSQARELLQPVHD